MMNLGICVKMLNIRICTTAAEILGVMELLKGTMLLLDFLFRR